jgi:nitrite reductase/ring-hydroxylating ferredoxin subunit
MLFEPLRPCAHRTGLGAGAFFDDSRRYLICATHGAMYEPRSGHCVAGPVAARVSAWCLSSSTTGGFLDE